MKNKKSHLGLGIAIGAAAGAVGALLLAPKAGKKTRKELAAALNKMLDEAPVDDKVKKVFGDVTADARASYMKARKELLSQVDRFKDAADEVDVAEYRKMVGKVVDNFKKSAKIGSDAAQNLKADLESYWDKMTTPATKKAVKKAAKKVAKKVSKAK